MDKNTNVLTKERHFSQSALAQSTENQTQKDLAKVAKRASDRINAFLTEPARGRIKAHSCKQFHAELKTPDGRSLNYALIGTSENDVRSKAENLIAELADAYGYDRIAWKLEGDRHWSFQGAVHERKSLWDKMVGYFFVVE